jgi:signal transduction histidine kinase
MSAPTEHLRDVEQLLGYLEQVESQLDTLEQGLARSHRLATLGTMAAIIAHEFNNILTPVISYCQLAEGSPDDVELLRKAVSKSHQGALKAAQISSSMLGFARDEDQAPTSDPAEVVGEVFACMARDPAKDGIDLHLDIPQGLSVAMRPVNLQQVLLNLVLNARRVLQQTGGRLTIAARPADDQVELTIADTGPGIPSEIRDRLFQPFVTQRNDAESPAQKGTGLGLAICKDLIERAAGSIHVDSQPGQGTTFIIRLPKAQP